MQHVLTICKNLVCASLLLRDRFKLVLESSNVVVSKHGEFVGKGYDCGCLLHFSLTFFWNKSTNHICGMVNDNASVWHYHFCHVNFNLVSMLSSLSLILDFNISTGSKCHSCVQSNKLRKPDKATEEGNLTSLELIHPDLCEMNGVLTKRWKETFNDLK